MSKTLLVSKGAKEFKIVVPDEAKITFGPWSPGSAKNNYEERSLNGTLRIYESKAQGANILAVWSGVTAFRLEDIEYIEKVVVQKGSTVWESSKSGYKVEEAVETKDVWGDIPALPEGGEDE